MNNELGIMNNEWRPRTSLFIITPSDETDNVILISGNEMPSIATELRSWAQLDGLPLTA